MRAALTSASLIVAANIAGRTEPPAELWTGDAQQALLNRNSLHPLGAWYHVAAVYDGREFRNYVNGIQDGAAEIRLAPQGPGRSSIGVRINLVNYFKGAIHLARFTHRALSPADFLKVSVSNRIRIRSKTTSGCRASASC